MVLNDIFLIFVSPYLEGEESLFSRNAQIHFNVDHTHLVIQPTLNRFPHEIGFHFTENHENDKDTGSITVSLLFPYFPVKLPYFV